MVTRKYLHVDSKTHFQSNKCRNFAFSAVPQPCMICAMFYCEQPIQIQKSMLIILPGNVLTSGPQVQNTRKRVQVHPFSTRLNSHNGHCSPSSLLKTLCSKRQNTLKDLKLKCFELTKGDKSNWKIKIVRSSRE
jgi:hypothetical protein